MARWHAIRAIDPYELMARICAMVPPPWFNMIRFHGVLAPNAKLREQVVASAKPYVPPHENTARNQGLQLPLFGKLFDEPEANVSHKRRKPWAWLFKHVFAIDVNVCPKCAGPKKWRQVALTADAIREGLTRAGLARGPPKRKIAPLGQLSLAFPKMRRPCFLPLLELDGFAAGLRRNGRFSKKSLGQVRNAFERVVQAANSIAHGYGNQFQLAMNQVNFAHWASRMNKETSESTTLQWLRV